MQYQTTTTLNQCLTHPPSFYIFGTPPVCTSTKPWDFWYDGSYNRLLPQPLHPPPPPTRSSGISLTLLLCCYLTYMYTSCHRNGDVQRPNLASAVCHRQHSTLHVSHTAIIHTSSVLPVLTSISHYNHAQLLSPHPPIHACRTTHFMDSRCQNCTHSITTPTTTPIFHDHTHIP